MQLIGRSSPTLWTFREADVLGGWACLTICDETGCVSLICDHGVFGYRWNPEHVGRGLTVSQFFATAGTEYILTKFSYDSNLLNNVPDPEGAMNELRHEVIRSRKCREISESSARWLWDAIENFCDDLDLTSSIEYALIDADPNLTWFIGDITEYIPYRPSLTMVKMKDLIPAIQSQLRAELEMENEHG